MTPRKKKRGKLASNAARKLIAVAHYAVLTALASVFGVPFWFFEQRRQRVADHIDNVRSGQ
jgi:hypothetical protein